MKQIIHLSLFSITKKDVSACGLNLEKVDGKVGASVNIEDVTCKNCKRTKIYKEAK
jgi:hypothetical protein